MNWVSDPPLGLRVVITGSDGVILAISPGSMLSEGEVTIGRAGDDSFNAVQTPPEASHELPSDAVGISARLIQAFADGIDTGNSPAPNFTDGLHSQIAIDAMRESAETGHVVSIAR